MDNHIQPHDNGESSTTAAQRLPSPIIDAAIAHHWRALAQHAQQGLLGKTSTPHPQIHHNNQMDDSLPHNVLLQYPFTQMHNNIVLEGAWRILGNWVTDTCRHIPGVSRNTTWFMHELPANMQTSDYGEAMGFHWALFKHVVPYVQNLIIYNGPVFYAQHSFQAWLSRQRDAPGLLQTIEKGLRNRLGVWHHPYIIARWKLMTEARKLYQTSPPRSSDFWHLWFGNRPEYLAIYTNFKIDRQLAIVLTALAGMDFSKENVSKAQKISWHWPHDGCEPNCPLATDNNALHTEETNNTNDNGHVKDHSPMSSNGLSKAAESKHVLSNRANIGVQLQRRGAIRRQERPGRFRSLSRGSDLSHHHSTESKVGTGPPDTTIERPYGDGSSSGYAASAEPDSTDSDDSDMDSDDAWEETFGFRTSCSARIAQANEAGPPNTPTERLYGDSTSSGHAASAEPDSSKPDDSDSDSDVAWEKFFGFRNSCSTRIANRPPTPYYPRESTFGQASTLATRSDESSDDDDDALPHTQAVGRPGTPHPLTGTLRRRNGAFTIIEHMPPLDLGPPMMPIQESDWETALAAASAVERVHDLPGSRNSSIACSGDESYVDADDYFDVLSSDSCLN